MRLSAFLQHIIKCSTKDNTPSKVLHYACPNAKEVNTTKNFMAQLKKKSKAVINKV